MGRPRGSTNKRKVSQEDDTYAKKSRKDTNREPEAMAPRASLVNFPEIALTHQYLANQALSSSGLPALASAALAHLQYPYPYPEQVSMGPDPAFNIGYARPTRTHFLPYAVDPAASTEELWFNKVPNGHATSSHHVRKFH